MTPHIDVVESDFHAGRQVRVARLAIQHSEYLLSTADPARWARVLELDANPILNSDEEAREFLGTIAARFASGDYLYAFPPHGDEECPFRNGDAIPMGVQLELVPTNAPEAVTG